MDLKTYLDPLSADERKAFAKQARTTAEYLDQLKGGHRRPSPDLARRLAKASDGALKLSDLRPDLWGSQ